jgi:hypothetical protein
VVETGVVEEAVDEEAVAGGETAARRQWRRRSWLHHRRVEEGREREHEEGEESVVRGFFPFFAWGTRGQRRGQRGGFPEKNCGMDSAWLSCEARFELHNRAWLRGYFRMRWAVPNEADPTYQTANCWLSQVEVRISEFTQATKHTLKDV